MARVLLTGASSFLGGRLAETAAAEGHDLHIVTRPTTDAARLPASIPASRHCCHDGTMDSILAIVADVDPEAVFHVAGYYSRDARADEVDRLVNANLLFGVQLLEAVKTQARPAIFLNAGSTFQFFHSRTPRPLNLYAATKQAFESLLAYYRDAYGIRDLSIILPDLYGPGDWRTKLLYELVASAESGTLVGLPDEDLTLNLLHVDDAAAAFLFAARQMLSGAGFEEHAYAATPSECYRISELVALVERLAGRAPAVEWGAYALPPRYVSTPWIGENLPGWAPAIGLERGLTDIVARRS